MSQVRNTGGFGGFGFPVDRAGEGEAQDPQAPASPAFPEPQSINPVERHLSARAQGGTELSGAPQGPGVPVSALIPDLEQEGTFWDLRNRFIATLTVVRGQLVDLPELSDRMRVTRAYEFFARFAERFVAIASRLRAQGGGTEAADTEAPSKEIAQAAAELVGVLGRLGFASLREASTGKDGIVTAHELLTAPSLEEFRRRASLQNMQPPTPGPGQPVVPEHTGRPAPLTDLGESSPELDLQVAFQRETGDISAFAKITGTPEPPAPPPPPPPPPPEAAPEPPPDPHPQPEAGTPRRLGSHMLWNVLHRFRKTGKDSAVEQEKWDKLALGAVLLLGFLVAVAVALATL